jgi:hypothetical protein
VQNAVLDPVLDLSSQQSLSSLAVWGSNKAETRELTETWIILELCNGGSLQVKPTNFIIFLSLNVLKVKSLYILIGRKSELF